MTWKLFTFSLFILTICSKLPFCPVKFYEPQKYKIFTFWWGRVGVFCPAFSFQMFSQSSSDTQSVLFRFPLPHLWDFTPTFMMILLLLLWWFTPAFMMIYSCFYDEVDEYRLNPHGYGFDFVSDADWSIFLPRIQNFQARKILVSGRENFAFLTKTNNIPAENQVHSSKEWSVFS